jgi:tRNA A-37 threonylcarbamoyl transferase component Bud32/tetratricopeptide (TPR) repeat protein
MTLPAGSRLGPYEIVGAVGAGGMGDVYRARDTRLEREVAVKVLSRDMTSSQIARERFQREARMIAGLHHPHVCAIYDVGETAEHQTFIVMEFLQGETLEVRLRKGPLEVPALLETSLALTDALAEAHGAGIVHRDIKPANIFMTPWGPKLLDFGVAKTARPVAATKADTQTDARPSLTAAGAAVGTLAYMSPEQLRGDEVDARTDLFSLGLVLFQMATGRPAFSGPTAAVVTAAILHEQPQVPSTLRAELTPRFDEIVLKALERDRALRYAHAVDLRADLQRLKRDVETAAIGTAVDRATAPTSVRRGIWWPTAAALVAAAAVGGGYWYSRPPAPLTDKETVVLADFANTTGDAVFDGTLRQGLAIQLQQSTFLSLTSDTRIEQLLRLMGQPAGARLTPVVARDICERMGGGAVLEGSIATLGTQYVLGVRASGCRSGEVLGEEQEQVARKEDVLNALSGIASRLRVRLGESLSMLDEHNRPLPDVSTSSLEALKAYSAALQRQGTQGRLAIIELFKRAVEIDDGFAVAHARLGTAYSVGGELALGARHATRAFELRERATDDEKFYIAATYHRQVTGNLEQALQAFDLWAQTYPRTFNSYNLASGFVTKGQGRYEGCIERAAKAEAAEPESSFGYLNAAACYIYLGRLDEAAEVLQRAADRKVAGEFTPWQFRLAFLRGDDAAVEREFARAQGHASESDVTHLRALAFARSAQLERAGSLSRRAVDLLEKAGLRERAAVFQTAPAVWHALLGNVAEARRTAAQALDMFTGRDVSYGAAFALALAGDLSRSQALLKDLEARFPQDTTVNISYLPALRGLIALRQGKPAEALQKLEPALSNEFALPGTAFVAGYGSLYPAYVRDQTYLAAKRPADAAVEFRKIISHRGLVMEDPVDAVARLQLARALAASGDTAGARVAYQDFLSLWKQADSEVPLLKQAQAEAATLR